MSWRDEAALLPNLAPVAFELDADRTALVVVDMQYVDAHRDYGLGASLRATHPELWASYFARVEQLVVPNTARLITAFREADMRVIYLTLGPVLADGGDMLAVRRGSVTPGIQAMFHPRGPSSTRSSTSWPRVTASSSSTRPRAAPSTRRRSSVSC